MYEKRAVSECWSLCVWMCVCARVHPPLIRVWWRPRGANQNERETEWGRVRERENAVIRVFIWVDGVCKSCPGLALGASVDVLVIRAVNECLKWVFLPRGGPASRRLWNIRHSAWTNNARGLPRFVLSCIHGHLLQNKHSPKSWLLKILTQQNKRLAFCFPKNIKVGLLSFFNIVLWACNHKRTC